MKNALPTIAAVLVLSGCSAQAFVGGGPAVPFGGGAGPHPTRPALALEAGAGLGAGDNDQGYGVELRVRGKLGADVTSAALAVGGYLLYAPDDGRGLVLLAAAGGSPIGASYLVDRASFDGPGVYGSLGAGHRVGDVIVLGEAVIDYTSRYGGVPSNGYGAFVIRVGGATVSRKPFGG